MKQRLFAFFLLAALFFALPLTAYADAGPKPSVRVGFSPAPQQRCYGTLLSSTAGCVFSTFSTSYGPIRKPLLLMISSNRP